MTAGQLTLRDLLVGAVDRFDDRPAVTSGGETLTYGELATQANGLSRFLVECGVAPGTPVALMMSNGLEYVVADQAVLRCGGAKVPLNDLLGVRDAEYILRDSSAVVAIATPSQLSHAVPVLADPETALQTLVVVGPEPPDPPPGAVSWDDAVGVGAHTPPEIAVAPTDVALLVYTGGTTGAPKGVVHAQAGLALNVLSHVVEIGFGDDELLVITSPLPHSSGLHLQAGMVKGAHAFVESGFDPQIVLERIESDRATFLFAVPTMIYRLLDHVRMVVADRDADFSSLRTILYGAAPITVDRLTEGLATFGPVFMQLYGQTEAPNFITRLTREDHDPARPERLTSCGRPVAMARVRIVDDHDNECPAGGIGEVTAMTPYTMTGYHGLPEKTAQTVRDGWLYTGDLGRVDPDGYLYLVDRKNDLIITGGMNVYSTEVENAIAELEGVAQVAVIGAPHPDWGEAVIACVVSAGALNPDEVIAHCRKRLSRYKIPKQVRLVEELPLTALGKLDKKALRAYVSGDNE
ncbi:AMP-binding protein [Gordonia bronchialis]|uniref:AMP-binding protein n=1 Tax=Gordonia bronchialis TaxID=2054 RepID=UPI001CBAC401|nr:AMP-binding protein [Gordonia bronchialis]UAK39129.1 AMP-binding protein [Gordonia bronchialis]